MPPLRASWLPSRSHSRFCRWRTSDLRARSVPRARAKRLSRCRRLRAVKPEKNTSTKVTGRKKSWPSSNRSRSFRRYMTLSTLWVLAEPSNGSFTSTSLELLSEARLLATTVAAITWGDGGSLASHAGEYGATTLYDIGDLAGALPGVPVAHAVEALIAGHGAPDAILIPATYD